MTHSFLPVWSIVHVLFQQTRWVGSSLGCTQSLFSTVLLQFNPTHSKASLIFKQLSCVSVCTHFLRFTCRKHVSTPLMTWHFRVFVIRRHTSLCPICLHLLLFTWVTLSFVVRTREVSFTRVEEWTHVEVDVDRIPNESRKTVGLGCLF